jgi:hypothetical protein
MDLGKEQDPISKITRAKSAGGVTKAVEWVPACQAGNSEFKPQYCQKKKKN